jgi:hypothetical protein
MGTNIVVSLFSTLCCIVGPNFTLIKKETHMVISKVDAEKMRRLAQEGKQISKIATEDFPHLDYWDVYFEVYSVGERSSRGIKRMITTRLNAIAENPSKSERSAIAEELHGLVWHLYENHKTNQMKLSKIRAALGE